MNASAGSTLPRCAANDAGALRKQRMKDRIYVSSFLHSRGVHPTSRLNTVKK